MPFLFFAPRPVRRIAAWITVALQVLILTTGNYTFFNWLTIALCMWLLIEPAARLHANRYVSAGLATFVGVVSGLLFLELFGFRCRPAEARSCTPCRPAHRELVRPLRCDDDRAPRDHRRGLERWRRLGGLRVPVQSPATSHRAPPVVAPHQPRLDWQMWFAALGNYQSNRWFVNFMVRLLQGEPAVLRLLQYNPFPTAPPKYIRARLYQYHFTHWGSRDWWTREERGTYLPPVSLR